MLGVVVKEEMEGEKVELVLLLVEIPLLLLVDSMLASADSVAVLVLGEVLMMNSTDEGHAASVVVVVVDVVDVVVVVGAATAAAGVVDVARSLKRFSLTKLDLPYRGFV